MEKKIGAELVENGNWRFRVWAPSAQKVEVVFKNQEKAWPLDKEERGYWSKEIEVPTPYYKFRLDEEKTFPDPASRSQPYGVHSWSQLLPSEFNWRDNQWKGRELSEMIIYELHVGTFTKEGSFDGIAAKLDHLEELGVNSIELMPIAQFPGNRNWGYDGVYPFAVQESYGGTEELKKLVSYCHSRNFSVLLDVVYNHLGPEGNYLSEFGPYFTDKYHTPWGSALNYDDAYSDQVRNHFIQNALMWLEEFHFDGLRLDAVHEIIDRGANHFLKELSQRVDQLEDDLGRRLVLIAESDLNDVRLVNDYKKGGYGLEGQWVDDFHHSLHTVVTGESAGYYQDYGKLEYLAKTFRQGFVYDGRYSVFRKRRVGNVPGKTDKSSFVVSIQNHDQVGNRLLGDRFSHLLSLEQQKLAAGFMLCSPFVPMLFMGEEFGARQPFLYFVSHGDPDLVRAVQEGRKREFEYFNNDKGEFPDPQAVETFESSRLHWNFSHHVEQASLFNFYKEMIGLRTNGKFQSFGDAELEVKTEDQVIEIRGSSDLFAVFNFGKDTYRKERVSGIGWSFHSSETRWGGKHFVKELLNDKSLQVPGNSFAIYQ